MPTEFSRETDDGLYLMSPKKPWKRRLLKSRALSPHAKALAQDMFQALWSFIVCVVVTVVVSLATKAAPDSALQGLVYGLTEVPSIGDVPLYQKPLFWAAVVTVVFLILNIIFW